MQFYMDSILLKGLKYNLMDSEKNNDEFKGLQ